MRDANRIPKLLLKLCAIWELSPDMRFGQLIENIILSSDEFIELKKVNKDVDYSDLIEMVLWHWEETNWEKAIMKAGEKNA